MRVYVCFLTRPMDEPDVTQVQIEAGFNWFEFRVLLLYWSHTSLPCCFTHKRKKKNWIPTIFGFLKRPI